MASQFQFQALQLVNCSDPEKPTQHDLAEEPFKTGQKEFKLSDLQELIKELNQRASSGRRNRNREWMKRFEAETASDIMARKDLPLTQAVMIRVTKFLRHEWGIKVIWFAAGKQDEVRMLRDCKMWSETLTRPANAEDGGNYDKLYGRAKKLNELIEKDAPLTFISPAPTMGGCGRRHKIQATEKDQEAWKKLGTNYESRMKRKFDCHIRQQKIDTFFVVITTIHNSDYEVIKQYLTKWLGNFLLLSAMSATLNPHIADVEADNYDPNYNGERLPEIKPGQRKNMKIIPSATWRLEHLAQLCQNNKGHVNTYEWGPNYVNPHKDYQASGKL